MKGLKSRAEFHRVFSSQIRLTLLRSSDYLKFKLKDVFALNELLISLRKEENAVDETRSCSRLI